MKRETPGKKALLSTIIAILAVGGTVSVGFSSWTFGNNVGSATGNISINADSVNGKYYSAYLGLSAELTPEGFVSDYTITNSATFSLVYAFVNYQDIVGKTLEIKFGLSYLSSSFSAKLFTADTCSVESGLSYTLGDYSLVSSFEYTLPSTYSTQSITRSVKITIKNLDFASSGQTIYEQLPKLKFNLETEVTIK